MRNKIISHLPWVLPAVAIVAVGSGLLDFTKLTAGQTDQTAVAAADDVSPAEAAVAAVVEQIADVAPAVAAPPANVSDQLAALLVEEADQAAVDVTRNAGFSIDVLENATEAALDEGAATSGATDPAPAPQPAAQPDAPVGADFFATASANLAAANSCATDLRNLASQARIYFPSGALTGEATGMQQARLIGTIAARCPGIMIEVQGHSDPSGDPVVNLRLSQERAESIIARMSAAGIDTSKFMAVGLGSAQPSGVTGVEPAAYYDRRVEFEVIDITQDAALATSTIAQNPASAACVVQLQNAVTNAQIAYAAGSVTMSQSDFDSALVLAQMAQACPQARLRVIGHHADGLGSVEDPATGRLRAFALMTTLVGAGVNAEQIILAAPGNSMPLDGVSDSRVDFDVILEDI